jgi:hypothetical protein
VLEHCIGAGLPRPGQIFFPDPWHKKRHHKRRLIQPAFATLLSSRLRPGGLLHLATDWEPYAEHMLEVLERLPALQLRAWPKGFSPRPPERPRTKFEARGERLPSWDLLYRRRPRNERLASPGRRLAAIWRCSDRAACASTASGAAAHPLRKNRPTTSSRKRQPSGVARMPRLRPTRAAPRPPASTVSAATPRKGQPRARLKQLPR